MTFGEDFIYKCPHCGNLVKTRSLMSGNTFGATFYSDSKMIAPMLPEFPKITKCPKCSQFFWLNEASKIKVKDSTNVAEAQFLSLQEYAEALQQKELCSTEGNERFLRVAFWHSFNDRVRKKQPMYEDEQEKELWQNNLLQLFKLLDMNNENDIMLGAEIKRSLGEFEECIKRLDGIKEAKYRCTRDIIKFVAKKNISEVFVLDTSFNNKRMYPSETYFHLRGKRKVKQGSYQEAIKDFEKAIFLDENNTLSYVLIAGVYHELGNEKKVLENLNKALAINENCTDTLINQALVYRHQRSYQAAQAAYQKWLNLAPRRFEVVVFNEEDIFRYGWLGDVWKTNKGIVEKGTLIVHLSLSLDRKHGGTALAFSPSEMPYFILRKFYKKPIASLRFVRFEFWLARCIFYIKTYIFRQPIKLMKGFLEK